jgi:hypothetical protein
MINGLTYTHPLSAAASYMQPIHQINKSLFERMETTLLLARHSSSAACP